jgi:hypothetical protein
LQKELRDLYDDLARRAEYLREAEPGPDRAREAWEAAHLAYRQEIERAAEAGEVSTLDAELLAKAKAADAARDGNLHNERISAARRPAIEARDRYERFIRDHAAELLIELAPAAERNAAEWNRANEEARKKLDPIETEHRRIANAVEYLLTTTQPFRSDDFPREDYARPALPSEDSLARYRALHTPPPAQDTPELAEVA